MSFVTPVVGLEWMVTTFWLCMCLAVIVGLAPFDFGLLWCLGFFFGCAGPASLAVGVFVAPLALVLVCVPIVK